MIGHVDNEIEACSSHDVSAPLSQQLRDVRRQLRDAKQQSAFSAESHGAGWKHRGSRRSKWSG